VGMSHAIDCLNKWWVICKAEVDTVGLKSIRYCGCEYILVRVLAAFNCIS